MCYLACVLKENAGNDLFTLCLGSLHFSYVNTFRRVFSSFLCRPTNLRFCLINSGFSFDKSAGLCYLINQAAITEYTLKRRAFTAERPFFAVSENELFPAKYK